MHLGTESTRQSIAGSLPCKAIGSAGLRGITDLIPAYADLTVCYDCTVISAKALQRQLRRLLDSLSVAGQDRRRVFQLPVCYGGDYGPDLDFVCHHSGLSAQEVIELHSAPDYLIYMLGFLPGFAYLGGWTSAAYAAAGQPTHLYSCGQCGNRRCANRGVPAGFSRRLAAAGAHTGVCI